MRARPWLCRDKKNKLGATCKAEVFRTQQEVRLKSACQLVGLRLPRGQPGPGLRTGRGA